MGKALIIKGADFSNVSVGRIASPEQMGNESIIIEMQENMLINKMPVKRTDGNGYEFFDEPVDTIYRNSVNKFDLTNYILAGFKKIKLTPINGATINSYIGHGNTIGKDIYALDHTGTGLGSWKWNNTSIEGLIGEISESYYKGNASLLYLFINTESATDNANIANLVSVELFK